MRLILVLLAFLLCSCGLERTQDFEVSQKSIINGQKCLVTEFQSSVEILVDALIDVSPLGIRHVRSQICGGTLIRPDVVLTAAHCLDEADITQGFGKILKLRFAVVTDIDLTGFKEDKKMPKQAVWALCWKKHEQFANKQNDIGLLFLSKSLPAKPVKLLSPEEREYLTRGSEVDIVGWGQQTVDRDLQDPATVFNKMCAQTQINELGKFDMQIGSEGTSARKCYGDSGGATYLTLPNGERRLVGVTSRSYDSKGCTNGGIDTRVDAYLDWIQEQLNMIQYDYGV